MDSHIHTANLFPVVDLGSMLLVVAVNYKMSGVCTSAISRLATPDSNDVKKRYLIDTSHIS